ncbi:MULTISPECIES: 50S ribosomal protein L23 [Spiroplasma]|uniref:Large ribosomal subunit protein uL23 n=2 Tax=Spiroplasma TaxID=2132 RepID=W0GNT9_9MOLU|nr:MULTISPECIES: 50S ribosomal protein L23 [Spiroplasma]AHF57416.1 50S ribosomal protein L23 [Spiroplasma eriocheiris CCTCC M 207170]AHF60728.1 50S ribosomal protein L23 [Spiroplasma mirum ATCC 29335]AHI57699.1 50S ribosomal protein L23 [Spiroplasma mirum ATCC 29335]AKM52846.1 50S ribosomal protein L23 [Spiroplasma atrichopogonis]AKM53872.1 50S ribosomal protein L23 [Spiroplasma eriocheiris]
MHITNVIKKPILTEKSYNNMAQGVYTFEVARGANKVQIKKAFEKIFEVKVAKVNVINYDPKEKRMGKFVGETTHTKRAIIKLKPGETLDLLGEDK